MDEAQLTIINADPNPQPYKLCIIQTQTDVCKDCSLNPPIYVSNDPVTIILDTNWPTRIVVNGIINLYNETKQFCDIKVKFIEGEQSNLTIFPSESPDKSCTISRSSGHNWDFYGPIYYALGIVLLSIVLWFIGRVLYRFYRRKIQTRGDPLMDNLGDDLHGTDTDGDDGDDVNTNKYTSSRDSFLSQSQQAPNKLTSRRIESLDTFRGLAIVLMIFVNYGGGGYWFFSHSIWNGLTFADLPFPWFVFIMGTSMAIGFNKYSRANVVVPFKSLLLSLTRRSAILFFLGLALNSSGVNADVKQLRVPGVLQRLAITNFLVALLEIFIVAVRCRVRRLSLTINNVRPDLPSTQCRAAKSKILILAPYFLFVFILLVLHVVISLYVPQSNGCPTGYLGPGGLHENSSYVNCTGGIASVIDRAVFTNAHMYNSFTGMRIYQTTIYHDPEGILGILTSVALCLLGLVAGKIIFLVPHWPSSMIILTGLSIFTTLCGFALSSFTLYDGWIPINKNLWSASYVLTSAGESFFLFVVFYLLVDALELWSGAPMRFAGKNSIFLYLAHEVFANYFPVTVSVPNTHSYQLLINCWSVCFWILVSYFMWRFKVFIRVM